MPKTAKCDFCLRPFEHNPRIKNHRFCQPSCRRKWHKAGPSLAGKKRAALQELIRETVLAMRKAGEI
jgi:hypothetical protein